MQLKAKVSWLKTVSWVTHTCTTEALKAGRHLEVEGLHWQQICSISSSFHQIGPQQCCMRIAGPDSEKWSRVNGIHDKPMVSDKHWLDAKNLLGVKLKGGIQSGKPEIKQTCVQNAIKWTDTLCTCCISMNQTTPLITESSDWGLRNWARQQLAISYQSISG